MVNYQFQRLSVIRQLAEIIAITILSVRSVTPIISTDENIYSFTENAKQSPDLTYRATAFPLLFGRGGG